MAAFLIAAVADTLLGVVPLARRVAALNGIRELRNGHRRRQLDAFAEGRRRSLARRLGLSPAEAASDG